MPRLGNQRFFYFFFVHKKEVLGYLSALLLLAAPASARPVLVELYTSTACSSCPPADALLAQLAADQSILPLSFNVTYWNGPAYNDADGLTAATTRQAWYAGLQNDPNVYTPEVIVDGGPGMVGSDRGAVTAAIAAAKAALQPGVAIKVSGQAMVTVYVPEGTGSADVLLVGYDAKHTTQVGGGENGGATITQINVVRSMTDLGPWNGAIMSFTISRPPGQHMAAILQTTDGKVLGVAFK